MSLTQSDLGQIRTLVREEVGSIITERIDLRFDRLEGHIEALENDTKEIYNMLSELQKLTRPVAHFEKHQLEQKILTSYRDILAIAKKAGVDLPHA